MSEQGATAARRHRRLFWVLLFLLVVLVPSLIYLGIVGARGSYAYYQFKIKGHSWVGQMWRADSRLGYSHVPEFRGSQSFAAGISIPVRIDEDGFRVPIADQPTTDGPLILAVGDSVTYGHGCEAKDTYPVLLANALGGTTRNSAVSGHGIAQMLLQAEDLIPQLKPDYVVVLYAGWLQARSRLAFSESRLAAIATPYLVADGSQGVTPVLPSSEPIVFGMGLERYWTAEPGVSDYLSFVFSAAIPLLIHNDAARASKALEWMTGLLPSPVEDSKKVAGAVYKRLAELTQENGATLVIVSWEERRDPMLDALPGVVVSYPILLMQDRLPGATEEEFSQKYHHWVGDPPAFYDGHPNAHAHGLVTEDILTALAIAEQDG